MGEKIYIGDGVYLDDDGYHIVLTTDRLEGTQTIYLDPTVFANVVMQGFRIMDSKTFQHILRKSAEHLEAMEKRNGQ